MEEQLEQPSPAPDRGTDTPSLPLEKEAKPDILRRAALLQLGQEASSSALLRERRSSNWQPQSWQTYS